MTDAHPGTPALLSLRNVGKRFANGVTALEGLDLDVRQGEILSLLGPSGCGKSTALRLIAGLAEPDAGTIAWRDGQRPEIGFVFQDATLMPWASVFDNVWLPLRLRGDSREQAAPRIVEALGRVGLGDFQKAYPRELSGGMKMRVSIARALVMRPALLLMDEPFAALDEITRARLNRDLLALQAELGATILFVTHSVYESVYLSSRIVVFSQRPGRVIDTIDVAPPGPRDEAFRVSSFYVETCRAASQALESVMQPATAR
ncbi:MAG: nitrate transporter ATPase [Hyphomicrobiales bacterium]|nr:nitrate transporter ATPase [Hyphomicrobiales bacterium]